MSRTGLRMRCEDDEAAARLSAVPCRRFIDAADRRARSIHFAPGPRRSTFMSRSNSLIARLLPGRARMPGGGVSPVLVEGRAHSKALSRSPQRSASSHEDDTEGRVGLSVTQTLVGTLQPGSCADVYYLLFVGVCARK